jgi:hypothetical protein
MANDEYPAEWFPQVTRQQAERERQQIINGLQELPTGVLKRALDEARKSVRQSTDGLATSGGVE